MRKVQCTVDLWTAGCAGSRLTAPARSPMDKPWTTRCVAHRLPTGRRLPTSSIALKLQSFKSGNVKTTTPAPALAYSSPVAVQATVTTAERPGSLSRSRNEMPSGVSETSPSRTDIMSSVAGREMTPRNIRFSMHGPTSSLDAFHVFPLRLTLPILAKLDLDFNGSAFNDRMQVSRSACALPGCPRNG